MTTLKRGLLLHGILFIFGRQFIYSKVVALKFTTSSSIKIYPNPAKNILQIESLNSSAPSTISIIDFSGNIVKKATVENNNYLCDVSNLANRS